MQRSGERERSGATSNIPHPPLGARPHVIHKLHQHQSLVAMTWSISFRGVADSGYAQPYCVVFVHARTEREGARERGGWGSWGDAFCCLSDALVLE